MKHTDPLRAFDDYFKFVGSTEAPDIFHRWSFISAVASCVGRKAYVPLGHFRIIPNMYIILMGVSGSRKTSAISIAKDLLERSGYTNFSADRTSKEKFISDLQELNTAIPLDTTADFMDMKCSSTEPSDAECFIVSDELQDFLGQGNIDFITMLGKLWEYREKYENRIKSGKSSLVYNPCVNILGGNTPTGFSLTFPPEIVGQGFLSRLLLVHGDRIGERITFPTEPDYAVGENTVKLFKRVRQFNKKVFEFTTVARQLLDTIYKTDIIITDARFEKYETRRFTHLLKLCAVISLMESNEGEINDNHVIIANTLLYYIERKMPQALGEFGNSKYSEVGNSIMERLNKSTKPLSFEDLWPVVAQDLSKRSELSDIIRSLQQLNKIQTIDCNGSKMLTGVKESKDYFDESLLMKDIMTTQEKILGGW